MVPLMGGVSGLFARTLVEMPYVENVRRGAPVDTTKKAGRAYVDVADGPNVYKVRINAAGNVMFNDDFVSPDTMLRNAMCNSLTEHFDELQKAHEMVGPFTVRILYDDGSFMPGGTTEADLQAVERAVSEGIREAVSKLSLSYPPELVREVLRLNVVYGVASRDQRRAPFPDPAPTVVIEDIMKDAMPSDTIIGPDTVVFDSDTIVVEKGKRLIVY